MPLELNARLTHREDIAPGLAIFRVQPETWDLGDFQPGQYGTLGLFGAARRCGGADPEDPPAAPEKLIRRAYSIASSSLARVYLEFYVVLVESGALTPRLFGMNVGEPIFLGKKVTGTFTLGAVPEGKNLVLISTGTGLAPYISMLRSEIFGGRTGRIAVIHGARHSWDLGYRMELTALAKANPQFTYIPSITRPQHEETRWEGRTGYIQDIWAQRPLEHEWGFLPTAEDTHIFLCGNPAMIDTMVERLEAEGYKEHKKREPGNVHLERYW